MDTGTIAATRTIMLAPEPGSGHAPTGPIAGIARGPSLLDDYRESSHYDEGLDCDAVREPYGRLLGALELAGAGGLRNREEVLQRLEESDGLNFRVTGCEEPQVFPVDLVPRLVAARDWAHISAGAEQRVKALDAFLRDVYGDCQIVKDSVVPAAVLDRAPGFRETGRMLTRGVRAHVSGLDLVSSAPGAWQVLEDNLRVPSGAHYAMSIRRLLRRAMPELVEPAVADPSEVFWMLLKTLSAAAPDGAACPDDIVLISSGPSDSAWSEHQGLAHGMGVQVLTPDQVWFEDGRLVRDFDGRTRAVSVVYLRMDEDLFLGADGRDGQPLGQAVHDAVHSDRLRLANALGNGVADDKAVYRFVPDMIDYYLGERPILDQVPTWLCAEPGQRQEVLERLGELVTKPIDGYGGSGVLIGPDASAEEVEQRRREIEENPAAFVAQEVVQLSTHPTFDGTHLQPRHVDLRVFVHLRDVAGEMQAVTMPAALTRVGPPGSKVVNSSAGGGSKDTWILTDRDDEGR